MVRVWVRASCHRLAARRQRGPRTGEPRWWALGDSLTVGDGDDAGGYPARLMEKIGAAAPGSTLLNLAQSGWDIG